nr:MAG: non-structural polyprotein [Xinjiang sediment hepe-like virus 1]
MYRNTKLNQAFLDAQDNKYLVQLQRDAIKVPFALTTEQFELLSEQYKPRIIVAGTAAPPTSTHALGAAHQRIAYHEAYNWIKNFDDGIEIGPNAANMVRVCIGKNNFHGCTLKSGRDQIRHAEAARNGVICGFRPSNDQYLGMQSGGIDRKTYHQHVQALANGIASESFCLSGWENCDHQAQQAIAVDSLYDIDFRQLALGMRNHNTNTIRAWLHIPVQATEVDRWVDHENGYKFHTIPGKGKQPDKLAFTWQDGALGYTHNKKNWLAYLTTGSFDTPFGFSVVIEKVRHWGSRFELRISRITAASDFFYSIPNSMVNLCKVPNFRELAKRSFSDCKPSDNSLYIITDADKVRRLYQFVHARALKGFTLETVKAYARTLITEIKLGGKIVEERWHCSIESFSDLCVSIYILATYRRVCDEAIIKDSLAHMQEMGTKSSFWDKICRWFSGPNEPNRFIKGDEENAFTNFTISFFKDLDCMSHTRDQKHDLEIFYGFNVEDIVPSNEIKIGHKPLAPEPNQEETEDSLSWATDLGLCHSLPTTLNTDYLEQNQHQILLNECRSGIAAAKAEGKAPLSVALEIALSELSTSTPSKLHVESMFLLTGVPGAGKTGKIIEEIIPAAISQTPGSGVLVLCPTAALRDKYQTELKLPSSAWTIHSGLRQLSKSKPALVIIEEAFTLPMAYINFVASKCKVLLVGDPNQIQCVDFSGLWQGCSLLEKYMPFIKRSHMNTTRRCPQDVAALPIMRSRYPGITSLSARAESIQHVSAKYTNAQAQILTFTQSEKDLQAALYACNASTVHETQGQTFPSVILHYAGTPSERKLLEKSKNHLIVGLTRHTANLFIRDLSPDLDVTAWINDSSPLNLLADNSNVELQALDTHAAVKPVISENTQITSADSYPFCKAEIGNVEVVLNKYCPMVPQKEQLSTISTELPLGQDAKGSLRLDALGQDEQHEVKQHTNYRFPGPQRVMITKGHNRHQLLRTNLERLTHHTKNLPVAHALVLADKLFSNLEREFDWNVSKEDVDTCFTQACEKMAARGHTSDKLKDVTSWSEQGVSVVKSFLKAQQKPMLAKDPLTADKAGQGISAWDKTLNIMMSAYTRTLELVLTKQSAGRIRVMTGMTDLEVMSVLEQDGKPDDRFLANDWTQFDSNQNNLTRQILLKSLRKIGCPDKLLEAFERQLSKRRICFDALSLTVNDKKDSGAPHTLVDNCLFNLAICYDLMSGFDFLYIKGDDSLARGANVSFDSLKMKAYGDNCGFKFKPQTATSGEFVSFIVNKYGVAFDLPRVTAKIQSRSYTSIEDYHNYQAAISAMFIHVNSTESLNMNFVNSYHYTNATYNDEDFDILRSFVARFARGEIPFTELIKSEAIQTRVDTYKANTFNIGKRLSKKNVFHKFF